MAEPTTWDLDDVMSAICWGGLLTSGWKIVEIDEIVADEHDTTRGVVIEKDGEFWWFEFRYNYFMVDYYANEYSKPKRVYPYEVVVTKYRPEKP